MTVRGAGTRERILDATQALVLERGFGGTSVDRVIAAASVSKGSFFHHFSSKDALALALVTRYAERDRAVLDHIVGSARRLERDPVRRLLLAVGLLAEHLESPGDGSPGCLFATFCYEQGLVTAEVRAVVAAMVRDWRETFGALVREAARARPPRVPVKPELAADLGLSVLEGAFVLARTQERPAVLAAHVREYRRYLEFVFDAP
jgi:AcrR family transcriptional regulator